MLYAQSNRTLFIFAEGCIILNELSTSTTAINSRIAFYSIAGLRFY